MTTKYQKQPINQLKSSKKPLAFLLCLFVVGFGYGQNLVPNFDFEEFDTCPEYGDQIQFTVGWNKVSEINSTPDYYNSCSASNLMGVPQSFFMYQPDHRGCNAFTGLVTWTANSNEREHIGIQLSQTMSIGQKYFISFYTVMGGTGGSGDMTWYYESPSDNIGLRLSTVPYSPSNPIPIDNFAHLRATTIINDTANWVRITGTIIADSAYNYLNLGNFYDDSNTDTITMNCANCTNSYSYYLIDDVCVSTDSTLCNGGLDGLPCNVSIKELNSQNFFNLSPNPTSDFFNIRNNLNLTFDINVYDLYGQIILTKKNISSSDYQIDLSNYENSIYIIDVSTKTSKYNFKLLKQ